MPSKGKKTFIIFSGGLGNQLFQLSAALFQAHGNPVIYNSTFGKPRLGKDNQVQIECFALPDSIKSDKKRKSHAFFTKVYGYTLRSGFNPNHFESLKFTRSIIRLASKVALFIATGKIFKMLVGNDVGYTYFPDTKDDTALIGYFQSYKWLNDPNVLRTLKRLKAKDFESREQFESQAIEDQPILLHVRLTDYVLENDFGLLAIDYYKNAIAQLKAQLDTSHRYHFWIFSDDIPAARNFLDFLDSDQVTWMPEIEDCPVKTLEVMSMCSHFIISNSTFSWWAASLRKNENAQIIYPDPWFKSAPTPLALIPEEWVPIKANWRS